MSRVRARSDKRAGGSWPIGLAGVLALAAGLTAAPATTQPEAEPQQERVTTPPLVVTTRVVPDGPPEHAPYRAKDGEHADANALLGALETAGASLQTLTANLVYVRRLSEIEGGERQVREGTLLFRARPVRVEPGAEAATGAEQTRREFQIDFTRLTIDGKARDDVQTIIFDGEWLIERFPEQKEIHRRQVVAPGEIVDPLAIGEGPFPIPIGQKRERILARFDAYLADPKDGWDKIEGPNGKPMSAPEWTAETYQLILVPKRGSEESRQYRQVRLWYIKDSLLPRMVRAEEANDSVTEVLLLNLKADQPLPPRAFDSTLPKGWNERVDHFRQGSGR